MQKRVSTSAPVTDPAAERGADEMLARDIARIVLRYRRTTDCTGQRCPSCEAHHLPGIARFVERRRPVRFVLPAFPTKSPSRYKVISHLPDLAEELGLRFLQSICDQIAQVYAPGARIDIASDGRVFNDLLHVPDDDVTAYQRALAQMIEEHSLSSLRVFHLEDAIQGQDFADRRATLLAEHGTPVGTLRGQIRAGGEPLRLYRGITRFLFEDSRYLGTGLSNTALQNRARKNAYLVIQRSHAWGQLVQRHHPDAVRLSIHPQSCSAAKLGILLGQSHDDWLTPWHCVAVATPAGFLFVQRSQAEAMGARLVYENGRPTHYLLTERAAGSLLARSDEPSRGSDRSGKAPREPAHHPRLLSLLAAATDNRYTHMEKTVHRKMRSEPMTPFGVLVRPTSSSQPIAELSAESTIDWLRAQVYQHQVVVLRGFEPFASAQDFAAFGHTWGTVLAWPFGDVLDVVERPGSHDHVFHSGYLPLHWDGMYVEMIPELQLFSCVAATPLGHGGETTFSHTGLVWDHADADTRAAWQRLSATYRINKTEHYGGQVTSPLVESHPRTGQPILRFNEPSRESVHIGNQHSVEIHGLEPSTPDAMCDDLLHRLHDPRHMYQHRWVTGDIVVADNYTLLHGRKPYDSGAPRHLRRIHVLGSPPRTNPAFLDVTD